jgi:hypothetical protein
LALVGLFFLLGYLPQNLYFGCIFEAKAGLTARALGIEPVCERASAKHKGESPTRSRRQAARVAPK